MTRLRDIALIDKAGHDPHTDGYLASAHHCLTCYGIVALDDAGDEIERLRAALLLACAALCEQWPDSYHSTPDGLCVKYIKEARRG